MSSFVAREGDVLVVTYPEVKVPVAQYWTVGIGGLIYTRKLVDGDDPAAEYERIYAFLKAKAEKDGSAKIQAYSAEARPPTPPKPAGREVPPLPKRAVTR